MRFLSFLLTLLISVSAWADDPVAKAKRILILGDSITYAGQWVDAFDAFVLTQYPDRQIEVIGCGLPSETVSGLSENGHAGGKFPRPDLHERLDRVLALVKPDLVFACYGMNCGVYLPLDEGRFGKYREGIEKLRAKVKAIGADIVHMTPAAFDAVPIKGRVKPAEGIQDGQMFEGYDGVLGKYSEWLMSKKADGWRVADVHSAMNKALAEKRAKDPAFKFSGDGIHPNAEGHRVMAMALIHEIAPEKEEAFTKWLDAAQTKPAGKSFLALVHQRAKLLCDSYLTTAGHIRPGMAKGLPVEEAKVKAAELTKQILEQRPAALAQ